ncbi:MAG TPA: DegQ family serine endoprotease [Candidatus Saccharimonadia bacterium]|nr:DegQ family serine endoprotease [Candidatus Saccharimonadia bacterium]
MTPAIRSIATLLIALTVAVPAFAQQQAALPDFTGLVERSAGAVVNITARKSGGGDDDIAQLEGEEVPEIFRRFFGDPRFGGGMPQQPRERVSGGSGFIISGDGYVLTNHHVVDGADEVVVRLKDRRELRAKVVGSDPQSDIALLKVEGSSLPTVPLGDSSELRPGQWVVAIGSPFTFEYSVTAGIVSAVGRSFSNEQRYVPFIQTDVAINRGNSGGPLFNLDGEVVGINSQIFSNTGGFMGVSFAIPIEVANSVVRQLKDKGRVSRGSLGVVIQRVGAAEAEAMGLARISGALVSDVATGSAAERAGVKVGDVLLSYNGIAIDDSAQLPPLVGSTAPGTRATLELWRDGKTVSLPITVGELEETSAVAATGRAEAASNAGLGLAVRDLTQGEREQLELEAEGVLIERINGTEPRRAGLQAGDVVLRVGRTSVKTAAEFEALAKQVKPGASTMLLVRRGDATLFVALRAPGPG